MNNILILLSDEEPLPFISDHTGEVFLYPGQKFSMLYRLNTSTPHALSMCRFALPDGSESLTDITKVAKSKDNKYYGRGLQNGECGIEIFNISEKNNGRIEAYFRTDGSYSKVLVHVVEIVVAGT